ncbi:alpha/beta hydrolase [Pseudonocardia sp. NPDC049635]|uniref:alpha/beta hydrolase n=1 Tax=Pseudonocardia sp. NPDC049635 TaxID=3155506 RepID=UPI003401FCCC
MRRTTVTHLVATVLAGAVLSGVAAPGAAAAPAAPAAPIAWGPCHSPPLQQAGAECGFLPVPLDHAEPGGEQIEIAVSRVRHTVPDEQYQGVMLVNPGGPGGPGLGLSRLGGAVPGNAGAAYDWIGFDPRGVGTSRPALICDPGYGGYDRPDHRPEHGAEAAWLPRTKAYAQACGERGGALLEHLRTEDTVRDMDLLRAALGAEQVNFYGFSYGTMLGQVYATMFPERVRRMVLDGIVDPRAWWYQANQNQNVAFERNIGVFFDWVAKNDATYGLGNSGDEVEARYYEIRDRLRVDPAGGLIGPAEWTDIFLSAGYNVGAYTRVADAFVAGTRGDAATLKQAYDQAGSPTDDNSYAVYLATQCTDAPFPRDWATWKADNTATDAVAPFETWGNAWYNAPCLDWPVPPGPAPEVRGTLAEGPLLISETYDGATPYEGALQARRTFPGSSLVEGLGGHTHSASLSGVSCVDDAVAGYLATGALPPRTAGEGSDLQCPAVPQPDPVAPAPPRS